VKLLLVILAAASLSAAEAPTVGWYSWGAEAFEKAKAEDKPIFLSIGHSKCQACELMERESFTDPEIGKLMNDAFVSIQVDREERPDLDSVYRTAAKLLGSDGAWPTNVVLTPDREPFFALAYVPKDQFRQYVPAIQKMWTVQRGQVYGTVAALMPALQPAPILDHDLGPETLEKGYSQLLARYDATKSLMPHELMFLLRYWERVGEARALEIVEKTLRGTRVGSEPLLALAYVETYQATRKVEYAQRAREIFADLLREKIVTHWSGLTIAALAYGATVLDEPKYADAATRAAEAVVARPRRFLDDYAFLVWGLLNLYEATFDVRWLQSAIAINGETLTRFRDSFGRLYITASDAEKLLIRPRETADGAIPSGNSVQLMNLLRLARITAEPKYETYATQLRRSAADEISLAPGTAPHLLSGLAFALAPSVEVVIAGDDFRAMRRAVFAPFAPNKVVLHRPSGEAPPIIAIAPYTKEQRAIGKKATTYVCTNYVCKPPTTNVKKVRALLTDVR
jgi:uncharacterized protein YyaL (SSP411 family)